jgi:Na+-driven multidrug efflux pump
MKDIVTIKPSLMRLKKFYSGKIIALGLPSGISQGILFVSILFVQTLINSMGSMVVACTTAIMRVDGFAILPAHTFNMSASTYTGQNIGAGNLERVRRGKRDVLIMSLAASVVLVALILIFGRTVLGWFTETQAIIDLGMRMMRIMAVAYCIMAVMQCYHGVMSGAGDTRAVMWISIMTNVVIRIPVAYIWAHFSRSDAWPTGSPDSIYVSMLVSWALGTLISLVYYRTGRWKTKSVVGAGAKQ